MNWCTRLRPNADAPARCVLVEPPHSRLSWFQFASINLLKKNTTNCVSLSWTISTTFLILNGKFLTNYPPFPFHVFKHNCWLAVIIVVIIININNNHINSFLFDFISPQRRLLRCYFYGCFCVFYRNPWLVCHISHELLWSLIFMHIQIDCDFV